MVKYTLNYFDAAGRGETVRLLFHAVGVEFTDNRMTSEQWKENKPDSEWQIVLEKFKLYIFFLRTK